MKFFNEQKDKLITEQTVKMSANFNRPLSLDNAYMTLGESLR